MHMPHFKTDFRHPRLLRRILSTDGWLDAQAQAGVTFVSYAYPYDFSYSQNTPQYFQTDNYVGVDGMETQCIIIRWQPQSHISRSFGCAVLWTDRALSLQSVKSGIRIAVALTIGCILSNLIQCGT